MMIMRIFSGRVIKLPELPFASGEVVVIVEVGAEVVGVVGLGVEAETEPSGMLRVCVLLQSLVSPVKMSSCDSPSIPQNLVRLTYPMKA